MFVSHIIDAFRGKSSSCWTPDEPFIQKKRPILTPFQRENRKIQGVGQKGKSSKPLSLLDFFGGELGIRTLLPCGSSGGGTEVLFCYEDLRQHTVQLHRQEGVLPAG